MLVNGRGRGELEAVYAWPGCPCPWALGVKKNKRQVTSLQQHHWGQVCTAAHTPSMHVDLEEGNV